MKKKSELLPPVNALPGRPKKAVEGIKGKDKIKSIDDIKKAYNEKFGVKKAVR